MKKEYRLPDEKRTDRVHSCGLLFAYFYLFINLLILGLYYSRMEVMLLMLLYPLWLRFDEAMLTFYPILEGDMLIIRNLRITSWGGEYRYSDIEEVRLKGGKQSTFPFLQVHLKDGKRSRNFSISALVDPARYQELVDDLRERGVKVSLNKMKGIT